MEKKTNIEKIIEHKASNPYDEDLDVTPYRLEMEGTDIIPNINKLIEINSNRPYYANKDFYIEIFLGQEQYTIVAKFIYAATMYCPTPVFDQIVYKYHNLSKELELFWSLPDREVCEYLQKLPEMIDQFPDNEVLHYVARLWNGDLDEFVKKENKEFIELDKVKGMERVE